MSSVVSAQGCALIPSMSTLTKPFLFARLPAAKGFFRHLFLRELFLSYKMEPNLTIWDRNSESVSIKMPMESELKGETSEISLMH